MTNTIYPDLESAGRSLALALDKYRGANPVVLAIANGGVPVAIPVAENLAAPLELLVIRRLFIREGRPFPVCGVSVGGEIVVDSDPRPLSSVEEQFKQEALDGLRTRSDYLRCNVTGVTGQKLAGRDVILVDNGIHGGSTMKIATAA